MYVVRFFVTTFLVFFFMLPAILTEMYCGPIAGACMLFMLAMFVAFQAWKPKTE